MAEIVIVIWSVPLLSFIIWSKVFQRSNLIKFNRQENLVDQVIHVYTTWYYLSV
jgi:hypothetical protein